MLDSIYHMSLGLLGNLISVKILSLYTQRCYGCHKVSPKICKPVVVYGFYCMALFHSQV